MKNFILCILIIGCAKIYAQEKIINHIGIKGGINRSNLTGGNFNISPGSQVEFILEATLPNHNTYQTSVGISIQGAEKTGYQPFSTPGSYSTYFPAGNPQYIYADVRRKLKFNYLWSSASIQFKLLPAKKLLVRPYFAPGIFWTYLLSAKEYVDGNSMVYEDKERSQAITLAPVKIDETGSIKSHMHRFNLGVTGSVGLIFSLKQNKIFIEGGGSYSFFNVMKNSGEKGGKATSVFGKLGYAFYIRTLPLFRKTYD